MKIKSLKGNSERNEPDIESVTANYEAWMRSCTTVLRSDLQSKHEHMKETPFGFLRGTFYRWAQLWPSVCADLCGAPKVLAVGDLHVNSFGTWRDSEGRLCWGVDDFDEAWPLPYTNDLVRLSASVKIATKLGLLDIKVKHACQLILSAYEATLRQDGCPIVLAEQERQLEKLGIGALEAPLRFWEKLNERPTFNRRLPPNAKQSLVRTFPA